MPTVSVIIPTHNRKQRVVRTVESVLGQSFRDFELIVVDDGSTDGTTDHLRSLFQSKIHLLTQEQCGVSAARNAGTEQSRGQYLSFLDSDDFWHRDKLKVQCDFHQQNPQFQISQTEEHWIRHGKRVNPRQKHQKPTGYIFPQSLHLCTVSPSSVMIRKSLFDDIGRFDERLKACEDYDLWLRLAASHPVELIAEKLLTKVGGHQDQLSAKYPAMDRFRLYSLSKVFLSGVLNDVQMGEVRQVIFEKLAVLSAGAEKRGRQTAPLKDLIENVSRQQITAADFLLQADSLLLDDTLYL